MLKSSSLKSKSRRSFSAGLGALSLFSKVLTILGVSACASTTGDRDTTPSPVYEESFSRSTALMSVMFRGQHLPEGVNLTNCQPAQGKSHVVLIHGTFSSTMLSFGALGPRLANAGYCVHSIDYGARESSDWFKAVRPVKESAKEVAEFIEQIRVKHKLDRVDLIGHSQGGLLGFYLIKEMGYDTKINHFLAMAPSVGGTTLAKAPKSKSDAYCAACLDQNPQSEIIRTIQSGPITKPGVRYTVLATENDYIVRPVANQFVREPGVRNLYIQDELPGKFATHSNMLYDDEVLNLVLNLLD